MYMHVHRMFLSSLPLPIYQYRSGTRKISGIRTFFPGMIWEEQVKHPAQTMTCFTVTHAFLPCTCCYWLLGLWMRCYVINGI